MRKNFLKPLFKRIGGQVLDSPIRIQEVFSSEYLSNPLEKTRYPMLWWVGQLGRDYVQFERLSYIYQMSFDSVIIDLAIFRLNREVPYSFELYLDPKVYLSKSPIADNPQHVEICGEKFILDCQKGRDRIVKDILANDKLVNKLMKIITEFDPVITIQGREFHLLLALRFERVLEKDFSPYWIRNLFELMSDFGNTIDKLQTGK